MMRNILWRYMDRFAIVYLNDIIIQSKTRKKHYVHNETVQKSMAGHQ